MVDIPFGEQRVDVIECKIQSNSKVEGDKVTYSIYLPNTSVRFLDLKKGNTIGGVIWLKDRTTTKRGMKNNFKAKEGSSNITEDIIEPAEEVKEAEPEKDFIFPSLSKTVTDVEREFLVRYRLTDDSVKGMVLKMAKEQFGEERLNYLITNINEIIK